MSDGMTPDRAKLVELAEAGRTSLASLSAMLGRNPSYLQQFVRKGSPRKLEEADRRRLAEFFGVSEVALGADPDHARATATDEFITVPRLPLDASAGPGAFSAEEISFDSFRFSRRWLREMGLEGADLTAIRVEGDSMEPTLRSGDEIFVDRNKRSGEGIHVVRIGDALHVKQVQASAPGRIALISANDSYAPIDLAREEVEVIGRVVWKGGRL
ncbi:transcriptional regulator [Erythrobacter sp. HI0019]|uniref:S24 family peptidase n=1 Tax=unclassified Erythrobacter TaxID=2633097 RepID=UPI0007B8E215|nr:MULTISPECIES: LexA family transcriptional regulator [unclassified Erythrobacter]KZX91790.1 transcriptional regulator [Erythrobacter sp. HI0019]KZY06710.1 transcriptional regulator [Erythrobacter sp. HI0028]